MLRALVRRIAQARLNHGLTQVMLASRIGLSLRSIRRMGAGAPGYHHSGTGSCCSC